MKNIVICADLKEESLKRLKALNEDLDLKHVKIHIIHVFEIQYYVSEFTPYVYPSEDQYSDMRKSAEEILVKLGSDLGVPKDHLEVHCFFAKSREEKIIEYLKASKANIVITATRGKHGIDGLFTSSFSDFLAKYSPCDILILRPKK